MENPLDVTEILPPESEYPELDDDALGHYEAAVELFIAGNWPEAFALLDRVPTEDRVKDFLLVRIAEHNRVAPPGWNGVVDLMSKR
jgi:adenylate cyclase